MYITFYLILQQSNIFIVYNKLLPCFIKKLEGGVVENRCSVSQNETYVYAK